MDAGVIPDKRGRNPPNFSVRETKINFLFINPQHCDARQCRRSIIKLERYRSKYETSSFDQVREMAMNYSLENALGTLRVQIPCLISNTKLVEEILTLLGEMPGVKALDINAITGNVRISYDEFVLTPSEIFDRFSLLRGIDSPGSVAFRDHSGKMFSEADGCHAPQMMVDACG